jgi:hypothetical protein
MRYFLSTVLTIAGACLLGVARAQAVQDVLEVVILNGPNAGTYKTPSDETICMHHKEMNFHALTWRDLDNHPKKLSIANIKVANSDRPGPKHGQVQIVFGYGKTPAEYSIKEAPITMTMKGKGGVLSFEGAVKGIRIEVTGTCSVFEDV